MRSSVLSLAALALAACVAGEAPERAPSVERDTEAPELFQLTARAFWDGASDEGGIWVAHPSAEAPLRVVIRNVGTESFVIGSLLPRDGTATGPAGAPYEVSSAAAEALGVALGEPAILDVTALARQGEAAVPEVAPVTPDPAPSPLGKPYVQIGYFAEGANADAAAERLGRDGIAARVTPAELGANTVLRVSVGPFFDVPSRDAVLEKVKALGFADAYPATG